MIHLSMVAVAVAVAVAVEVAVVVPRDTEVAHCVALAAGGLRDTLRCGARAHRASAADQPHASERWGIATAVAVDAEPKAFRTASIPEPSVTAVVSPERLCVAASTVVASA